MTSENLSATKTKDIYNSATSTATTTTTESTITTTTTTMFGKHIVEDIVKNKRNSFVKKSCLHKF